MEEIILKKGSYSVRIATKGMQILGFTDGSRELLHQGASNPDDPSYLWFKTAPRLNNPGPHDASYTYNGRTYTSQDKQHGNLSQKEFTIVDQTESYVLAEYEELPNEEFPFAHKVCIKLSLTDRPKLTKKGLVKRDKPELEEEIFVVNTAKQHQEKHSGIRQGSMIYSYGQHPAFQITNPQTCFIYFSNLEKEENCTVEENVPIFLRDIESLWADKPKAHKMFGLKKGTAHLCQQIDDETFEEIATLDFEGPNFLIWSKNISANTPHQFVCMEPWLTMPNAFNENITKLDRMQNGEPVAPGEIAKNVILLGKKNSRMISTTYGMGRGIVPFSSLQQPVKALIKK